MEGSKGEEGGKSVGMEAWRREGRKWKKEESGRSEGEKEGRETKEESG